MNVPHTRTLRTLLLLAALAGGCDVFEAKLYQQVQDLGGGTADLGAGGDLSGGAAVGDLSLDPDAGGYLCGRSTPSTLCPASWLFCDGFEDEMGVDFSSWSNYIVDSTNGGPNPGTTLGVTMAPVCLGGSALHAKTVGGNQQSFVYEQLGSRPSTLHVRFYFYLTQFSQQPFQIVGFHAPSNDYATLYIDPKTSSFNYANSFNGLTANFGGADVPVNQWLCLELTTRFDGKSGEVRLQLDGQQLGDLAGAPTDPSSPLDTVNVGIISTAATDSGTNEVYIDEVAMSDSDIGCL